MKRQITITDTTLRDGQQSLWASRMPMEMMLPVAEWQNRAGVDIVDTLTPAALSSALRYMQEDPWEKLRALRRVLTRPALAAGIGEPAGFRLAPEDIYVLQLECYVRNGIDMVRAMNGLLDLDDTVKFLTMAKKMGVQTIASFVFSQSPVHTDELYAAKVREVVERADADWIMIKDSGGLLTPERTGPLLDAVRQAAGTRKVTLHTHCMTGLAGRVYMVGVEHGADNLQCGIWPLAQGSANPPMQATVRNLRAEGYTIDIDEQEIEAASEYLVNEAQRRGFPLGAPQEYDAFHYRHQVPGGMISHFKSMLKQAGLLDQLPRILEEISIVREELGWPTLVTPYSQFVGNQALFNVVTGERYAVVPDEVKMYALGAYGKLLAPIQPDVLDRIMENGPARITDGQRPGPAVPELRKRYPGASEEELLLRYIGPEAAVEDVLENRERLRQKWAEVGVKEPKTVSGGTLADLLGHVAELTQAGEVVLQKGDVRIRLRA